MEVTHYFDASLTSPVITTIPVMQGDGVRLIVARLMEEGKPWPVPEGVTAGLSYEQPGKAPGYYDRLADDTAACVIDGNQVSVVLEPVLTERAGPVKASIILRDPDGTQVATFPFHLWVERVPGMVHGENLMAPAHVFEGKIYYGGVGGVLVPLGLGSGIRAEEQEDGSLMLVAAGGSEESDPLGTADRLIGEHNASQQSHEDIRLELEQLAARLTAFFDSDDQTLDELSEIVAYIESNKSLIDAITTSKVSVADIVDNFTTDAADKPLSARMGLVIKNLLDQHEKRYGQRLEELNESKLDADALPEAVAGQIQAFEQGHDLELITSFTLEADVSNLTINEDSNGKPFSLETAVIEINTKGQCVAGDSGAIGVNFGTKNFPYDVRLYAPNSFPWQGVIVNGIPRDSGIRAYASVRNKLGIAGGTFGDFGTLTGLMSALGLNYLYRTTKIEAIHVITKLPQNAVVTVYGVRG